MSENLYRKVTAEEIEYEKQESRFRFELAMNTMKSAADRKGFERGRAEGEKLGLERGEKLGLERGVAQEKREIAKNFKSSGIPLDIIAANTGLSVSEIEKL